MRKDELEKHFKNKSFNQNVAENFPFYHDKI